MKQRNTITELIFRTNSMKMLKSSLTGPTKNLHVKTGVLRMSVITRALHIWASSLFFIDLFQSDTSGSESDSSAIAKLVLKYYIFKISEVALIIFATIFNFFDVSL